MEEEAVYIILEVTYAQKHNIDKNDEDYRNKISSLLPSDWYIIPIATQIPILLEAIQTERLVEDTTKYNNMFPTKSK